jgi:predicted nucleic acid-binding Zn finger protein
LTLESLLTTELGKAVASQDDTLALALAKAARLVNHDAVRPTDTPAAYTVDSATDTTRAYAVSDGICACVDYVKRAHRLHAYCVHTLAVDFYARLSESL